MVELSEIGLILQTISVMSAATAAIIGVRSYARVWVMDKRGENYTPERVRVDLVQDLDRCLHHYAGNPGSGFKVVNLGSWSELDEIGLLRTTCRATIEYEKIQI